MRTTLYTLYLFLFASSLFAQSTVTVRDSDIGPGDNITWTSDHQYLLDGYVFVDSGASLTIEAGTVIKGLSGNHISSGDPASALIVVPTAKIYANGTEFAPIIFTAELDDVNDPYDLDETDRGLWGGVIILGSASLGNSSPIATIEGIPSTESRIKYGGHNDDDNSGILKYVSIRHGGAELSPGDEINGLSLGGVGSATTLEHIEIFANKDDGIEFFGGRPNLKWAIAAFCADDGFDWDLGYRGSGQFWFCIQALDEGDHAAEMDGAKPDGNAIYSNPTIYNATYLGTGRDNIQAGGIALLFRDASAGKYYNSIFTDFSQKIMQVEDLPAGSGVDSRQRMEAGELVIANNLFYDFNGYSELSSNSQKGYFQYTSGAEDSTCQFLIDHFTSNNNYVSDPEIQSVSRLPDNGLDPRPAINGPATQSLASYPADSFFTAVSYKGAFDPYKTNTWAHGWTALDMNKYLNAPLGLSQIGRSPLQIEGPFPNPSNGVARFNFKTDNAIDLHFDLTDIRGRIILSKDLHLKEGENQLYTFDLNGLPAGIYPAKISGPQFVQVRKIILQ